MPASARRSVYLIDSYWLPRSLWWISLSASDGLRWQMAWFRASRTLSDQRATGSSAVANGGHRGRDAPADNLAGEDVDDECDIDHALPA